MFTKEVEEKLMTENVEQVRKFIDEVYTEMGNDKSADQIKDMIRGQYLNTLQRAVESQSEQR